MKSYMINISSTDNSFIGTGFTGVKVSSFDDVRQALLKYATFTKDNRTYWQKEIKVSFLLASTIDTFKTEGDRQCQENGFVDLFKAIKVCKSDPFRQYTILFRPNGWIDREGNEFKLVLIKGSEVIPFMGKWSELLSNIGIIF